jgi:hypothetical protein
LEPRGDQHFGQVEHYLAGRGIGHARQHQRLHLVHVAHVEIRHQLDDRAPVGRDVAFAERAARRRLIGHDAELITPRALRTTTSNRNPVGEQLERDLEF